MDGLTRISYYFPTGTLTVFQIISNLVINDVGDCAVQERQLMIALVVIFSLVCFLVSFTDTYTAYNGLKFWVILVPMHGPICFSLPTEEDKDRVWDSFRLKVRSVRRLKTCMCENDQALMRLSDVRHHFRKFSIKTIKIK